MEVLTNFLQGTGSIILMALIQILVCAIGVYGFLFIKRLAKKAGLDTEDTILRQIESIINSIVCATNQKIVDKLKELSPDGKLTDIQAEEIFNAVKNSVVSCLNSDQIAYLINQWGTVDDALEYLIESFVSYNHTSVLNSSVGSLEIPEIDDKPKESVEEEVESVDETIVAEDSIETE